MRTRLVRSDAALVATTSLVAVGNCEGEAPLAVVGKGVVFERYDMPGVTFADIDLADVASARDRIPALSHDREFTGPAGYPTG